jgi:hypothetical protein
VTGLETVSGVTDGLRLYLGSICHLNHIKDRF